MLGKPCNHGKAILHPTVLIRASICLWETTKICLNGARCQFMKWYGLKGESIGAFVCEQVGYIKSENSETQSGKNGDKSHQS